MECWFHKCSVGSGAGYINQDASAVAIGNQAGYTGQGNNSVAIGNYAGSLGQHASTIILNASSNNLSSERPNSFYVKPIRQISVSDLSGFTGLYYNPTTGEIAYK